MREALNTGNAPYAVITGASGGLGKSFATACAARGYNLLMVDVAGSEVKKCCEFLQKNFDTTSLYMEADITTNSSAEDLLAFIRQHNIQVGLLINNAGIPQNEFFASTQPELLRNMVNVNCLGTINITKALLPELRKQPRSHIISVSSLGSFYTLPRKTCYSATKGFIRQFCQALAMEEAGNGVRVSVLCPGPMTTNIDNYLLHRQLNWFSKKMVQKPENVSRYTLQQALKGREIIIPGRMNRILKTLSSLMPAFLKRKLSAYSMKQLGK